MDRFNEMAKVLKADGASDGKIQRYKMLWKQAKDQDNPRPCPVCFGTPPGNNPGNLTFLGPDDGKWGAKCSKCKFVI